MADRTGIDVVYDFRTDDIRSGGHGAPISVSYHHALLKHLGAGSDTAIINLGGVANLSWAGTDGEVIGFRSEEHTSELQSLMRISYAVFCLKKKKQSHHRNKRMSI